ncbi:uncharacterized protein LOC113345452 [Papaver somniferum]|uniref:uncharacterized protein LOC113345452 n=1 Tax=Papaver somniferum TaxID=3469 RepID=UPI000E701134|nr:uncharacterized protein LOC113345452 [Papaver somniferum]
MSMADSSLLASLRKYPKQLKAGQSLSRQAKKQHARLYIIWRCSVMLLCWHE